MQEWLDLLNTSSLEQILELVFPPGVRISLTENWNNSSSNYDF
jgi:hypothetical protein